MSLIYPPKPRPGDRVAVVSPGSGLPGILPLPYERGLRRLREEFELEPVEYPTTRKMGSTPAERAADLHAAFSDDSIAAVIASIGGDDQITVLKHLDAELLRANPKPFMGYSDNTNVLAFLSSLGIVGYHGPAIMTDFGRGGAMHPLTVDSARAALFTSGDYRLAAPDGFTDIDRDWNDPANLETEPPMMDAHGWRWHHPSSVVTGRSWGGCLEIVAWLLASDRCVPTLDELDGAVLFFETSEELPPAEEVYRTLRCVGERGILGRCGALLMGRPKAWNFEHPNDDRQRAAHVTAQREAVLRAMGEYAPDTAIVLDVDFGHTDPMVTVPYGGQVTVDGPARSITVRY
ncbi:MAG TPA: S66 peptidase family protein [Stackebrandtia sp.]|jgi:muramoyltetrapeptide carboxypeptidase LdcA involved in peptidoglycan recycling|uniref:S66 family peptidase n=1 Tax=Stackebrandtia sp. TaxID=2023065 RepID=UPI002D2974CE|nr:S66 peptidase family protein [Stackebrandtia sp.]HZE41481.1 S66 peptidase family protein [Stackebrandtia sp.]